MKTARRTACATLLALALGTAPAAAAPGDLDPSFGGDGVVAGAPASVASLALAGDRLLTAGTVHRGQCSDAALVRWLPDGTLDRSFAAGGVSAPRVGPCDRDTQLDNRGEVVAAAPGGRVLMSGGRTGDGRIGAGIFVAAHTPEGALDAGFGGDGWVVDHFQGGRVTGIVALPDGRVIAGGIADWQWEVHRYLPDGTRDASFGGEGAVTYPHHREGPVDTLDAFAADGDDGAVVGVGTAGRGLVVSRIAPDGTLDPSFAGAGTLYVEWPGHRRPEDPDMVRTPDGAFVVAVTVHSWRSTGAFDGSRRVLLRVRRDGTLDPAFGAGGRVDAGPGRAGALGVDPTGRIVLAGDIERRVVVSRYGAAGRRDRGFASPSDLEGTVRDLLVQPDGRTVVAIEDGDSAIVRLQGDERHAASSQDRGGAVRIRIVDRRVRAGGVLVRATWPRGSDGSARARLWARGSGILLGERTVAARPGSTGRTFRVPLNRTAQRLLRGGERLKVRATLRVTGVPGRATRVVHRSTRWLTAKASRNLGA